MEKEKKPVGRPRKYAPGKHPNTLKAIEDFAYKKGESGNLAGPKVNKKPKPALDEVLNQVGHERCQKDGIPGVTKYEAFARQLWKDAMSGKSPAVKELAERLWGKSPDFVNINIKERPKFKEGANAEKYIEETLFKGIKAKA